MENHSRHDMALAQIVGVAVELYANGQRAQALALLAQHHLSDSVIGRVLCDTERSRSVSAPAPHAAQNVPPSSPPGDAS